MVVYQNPARLGHSYFPRGSRADGRWILLWWGQSDTGRLIGNIGSYC